MKILQHKLFNYTCSRKNTHCGIKIDTNTLLKYFLTVKSGKLNLKKNLSYVSILLVVT